MNNQDNLFPVFVVAVKKAIKEMGMDQFKKCSWFGSQN